MRVLAVAQALLLNHVQIDRVGHLVGQPHALVQLLFQPASNGAVVGVSGLEHAQRQLAAGLQRGGTVVGAHFLKDGVVAGRIGDHSN